MENENTKREGLNEEPIEEVVDEILEETADEVDAEAVEETVDEAAAEEPTKEIIEKKGSVKKQGKKLNKKKLGIIIAVAVAVILALGVFFVCYTEGVGSNTVVNKPVAFNQTQDDKADNIKYENPVVSLFDAITGKNENAVMKVNNKAIDKDIFNFFANSMGLNCAYSLLQTGALTDPSEFDWNALDASTGLSYKELSKAMAIDSIVPVYATIAEGEKRGIKLSEEDEKKIKDWIDEQKKNYGDKFEEVLKNSGYPDEETLYDVQYIQVYMQKVYDDINNNIENYMTPQMKEAIADDKVTVKHILILAETEEAKKEVKNTAEEVLAKAKSGEDFDELIAKYNEDPGATSEGYTFANDGTMVQEFADASFALQVGEISDLVETSYGYHIIKRMERVITADDYINSIGQSASVRLKKGVYDKMAITINLNDFFGGSTETPSDSTNTTNAE